MFSSKPATTNPQENVRDLISILSNDKKLIAFDVQFLVGPIQNVMDAYMTLSLYINTLS